MTLDSLPYRQASRNEAISSLLTKCPIPAPEWDIPTSASWLETDRRTMMDERGEGVAIILDHSERLSERIPEYRLIDDAELLLTIYAADLERMSTGASG